jgi:inhibitor of KinA
MEITPLGDCAAVIHVADEVNAQTLEKVLAVRQRLEAAGVRGILEIASAYATVAVFYDPALRRGSDDATGVFDELAKDIQDALAAPIRTRTSKPRLLEIPVCYDEEFGPDLAEVAVHAGMTAAAVAELHSRAEYGVSCIGFTPGFPFLTGLPAELATPRKSNPRKEVPAGSVAIGGSQTGIYPTKSPGGWNIIGRTPLRLFDPQQNPPSLLVPGDRVRFRPITRDEFMSSRA